MSDDILLDVGDGVATITLNRPDRLNAYTARLGAQLYGAFRELDAREDVRAIIVTGSGRAFCAGADLEAGGATFAGDRTWDDARALEEATRPWNLATPIIAAINGPAVGIGATLPLQWDIRLASDRAKIGFVFARRGIVPEALSTWILPRLVGFSRAMELCLSARLLGAEEALAFGLVSRVVPHDSLLAVARELALDIARHTAPGAIGATKRLLWRQLMESDPRRAKDAEDALFFWSGKQPDAAEGVTAFLEKRTPRWTGSKHAAPVAPLEEP